MKPKKQTIYLPVKVEDEKIPEYTTVIVSCEGDTHFNQVKYYASHFKEDFEMVTHWLKPQEAIVFTPEHLNEYTANVIKQTLETAAENVKVRFTDRTLSKTEISVESITNAFEETFKRFEV